MKQLVKRALVGVVALSGGLLVGTATHPASAQALSPGCQTVNDPDRDGTYGANATTVQQFSGGEQVTVVASTPVAGPVPSIIGLFVGRTVGGTFVFKATTSFPGTLSYVFPTDTTTTLLWYVLSPDDDTTSDATWKVSCQLAPPTNPEQCRNGGHEALAFRSQGDCISFVTTDGKNEPGQNVPKSQWGPG